MLVLFLDEDDLVVRRRRRQYLHLLVVHRLSYLIRVIKRNPISMNLTLVVHSSHQQLIGRVLQPQR